MQLGRFEPLADYDWKWPKNTDKSAVDELFKLSFFEDGANSVQLGPNGVGKTMLLKNLAHHSVMRSYTVRFNHGHCDAERARAARQQRR